MAAVPDQVDVVIIGAGPSGAIASALLKQRGFSVIVFEKEQFPRFSIGESLLPQCMQYVEQAGFLPAVRDAGFQFKNGAAFGWGERSTYFNFEEKFSPGHGTTFQVERARFDKLLADEAQKQGVDIRYCHSISDCQLHDGGGNTVTYATPEGESRTIDCRFVLDASGFGRVLPRLLDLETPSDFPVRQAAFTHIDDGIESTDFDRNKILVTVHPEERDIWYWLIPFSGGKCSVGVVASEEKLRKRGAATPLQLVQTMLAESPVLANLLQRAQFKYPANQITGYSCNVKSLANNNYALLGNAGEFLDPVFSSGVTIAMRSASMAVEVLAKQLDGEAVDWQNDYEIPLRKGVDTFRVFVDAWYDGLFQDIIFYPEQSVNVREMISSILAGYAWDEKNPFVAEPRRRMRALAEFCSSAA
ncbi:NAD(P)/FAD-dependent oxidoreductase [Gilvimarinus sp. SDUM040013]|uniref:NAD(P)/FAD-dependent oxidoreductase n=1 Tax=Gilvimarinus gilvus TaxID=3058038 RepID=A0ABU4S1P3_9GAMM|nr:NAD(P)/FAD-dependent oxidoreductase [Gilvimarinus sp. SDUM040013]MDO3387787.1 NAD(P)/FAD-dependent oxidoreductase [Gilvimarinus sp. SDUM040013]MDX6851070.1 NAD(P)/FAD-dependent oxidoreductase [Gilvimarinus sp. SDUM040013]